MHRREVHHSKKMKTKHKGKVFVIAVFVGFFAAVSCSALFLQSREETNPMQPSSSILSSSAPTLVPSLKPTPVTFSEFIEVRGTDLFFHGKSWKSVGVNRYDLLGCRSDWGDEQVSAWFAKAKKNGITTVRFWLFQSDISLDHSGNLDFSHFDKIIQFAKQNDIKLLPTLENHLGDCTWGPNNAYNDKNDKKNDQWYSSGYTMPLGNNKRSYRDYVGLVLRKYGQEPSIGVWDLINEPEARGDTLITFARDMHEVVKKAGPKQPTTFGTLGTGQHGAEREKYTQLLQYEEIGSVHLYPKEHDVIDPKNGLQVRLEQAQEARKPLLIGELGIGTDMTSLQERANIVQKYLDDFLSGESAVKIVDIWSAQSVNASGRISKYDIVLSDTDPIIDLNADPTARVIKAFDDKRK